MVLGNYLNLLHSLTKMYVLVISASKLINQWIKYELTIVVSEFDTALFMKVVSYGSGYLNEGPVTFFEEYCS